MKKYLFFIIVLLCIDKNSFAQIQKGSSMMGFNLNGTYNQNKNNTGFKNFSYSSSFNINPNVGFFVRKNSCIGFTTGYTYTKNFRDNYEIKSPIVGVYDTSYTTYKNVTNAFNLGLFYRKYIFLNDKFALAANFTTSASYGLQKERYQDNGFMSTQYSYNLMFNLGISPTMIYFPHPQYGIELSYGYIGYANTSNYYNKEKISTTDAFKFNFGPSSLQLGFHYYMFKKTTIKK